MKTVSLFRKNGFYLFLFFLYGTISSCSPTIALYDQFAYTQAVSLKVDMQNLAEESATVNYPDAKADIDKVNIELKKAYEYANGRSKNAISTKQYSILLSESDFYKTFLNTWKTQGKESATAAGEFSKKLGQLMDQIIELENGKGKN